MVMENMTHLLNLENITSLKEEVTQQEQEYTMDICIIATILQYIELN